MPPSEASEVTFNRSPMMTSLLELSAELERRAHEHRAIAEHVIASQRERWSREAVAYQNAAIAAAACATTTDGAARLKSVASFCQLLGGPEEKDVWVRVSYLVGRVLADAASP